MDPSHSLKVEAHSPVRKREGLLTPLSSGAGEAFLAAGRNRCSLPMYCDKYRGWSKGAMAAVLSSCQEDKYLLVRKLLAGKPCKKAYLKDNRLE